MSPQEYSDGKIDQARQLVTLCQKRRLIPKLAARAGTSPQVCYNFLADRHRLLADLLFRLEYAAKEMLMEDDALLQDVLKK